MSDKPSRMAGETITLENGALLVPNNPTIHYIEGDGIGVDISPVMIKVVDAAVAKAYNSEKQIHWSEVLAGEKAFNTTGEWLPRLPRSNEKWPRIYQRSSNNACWRRYQVLNVALRQKLDLFACVRPVRWKDEMEHPLL